MTTFDDRETAFEARYARDADLQFQVTARRDRLTGLWGAAKLGHSGEAAENYAKSVVIADLAEAGDEDVVRKLVADLAGVGVSEADVRAQLVVHGEEARRQIMDKI
jgi:hypothetical protein